MAVVTKKCLYYSNIQTLIIFYFYPSRDSSHLSVPPQPPPRSGRLNMPTSHMQHFDVVSPPLSGRSTPKAHVPNVMPRGQDTGFMHKYHTVSIY